MWVNGGNALALNFRWWIWGDQFLLPNAITVNVAVGTKLQNHRKFCEWSQVYIKKNESMKKADKRKKLKVYYIDVQDFALLAETLHTQQICKCTFVHCVSDLLYPVLVKLFSSLIGNKIIPHKLLTEHF